MTRKIHNLYYEKPKLTEKHIEYFMNNYTDELCSFCELKDIGRYPGQFCEGSKCNIAFEDYIESLSPEELIKLILFLDSSQ